MLQTIAETIKDAKEQVANFGEVVIDLASDNDAWDNVPLVDYATKALNIRDSYRKNKLKRNYAAFIKAVSSLEQDEAEALLGKMTCNGELSEETSEIIFEVISESARPLKAELLGNLSVALARDHISLEDFNTLALTIEAASLSALKSLPAFLQGNDNKLYKSKPGAVPFEGLLFSLGVATRHGNMFRLDQLAMKMAVYGFKIEVRT